MAEEGIFSAVPEIGAGVVGTSDEKEASLPIGTWGDHVPVPSQYWTYFAAAVSPAPGE